MLLYLDYRLQVSKEVIIGPENKKINVTIKKGKYVMDKMNGNGYKGYDRLKQLVNDIDDDILNYLDKLIF
ncbi:hypothetical protein JOC37_002503 [Desulfohalotomaculum tongense]|uniref:hypothetical protein n=1 Tax=Desulforadius tongensis TaxID=1216062 RepID=UPI00195E8F8F|nr:hypothetical protein [Desulforadius tongensis]MBM7856078.1 hypothetical protein [Desulforadius tongensis]